MPSRLRPTVLFSLANFVAAWCYGSDAGKYQPFSYHYQPHLRSRAVTAGLFEAGFRNAAEAVTSTVSGIAAAYEDEEFVPDGFVKASHILFLTEEAADAKASALAARIASGELTFGRAALLFSACPSRDLEGRLGIFQSLSRLSEGTLRGDTLPYEGMDTRAFDDVVFSASTQLGVVHQVRTQWGTHLVLVEARGGPLSEESLMAQASDLVDKAMGGGKALASDAMEDSARGDAAANGFGRAQGSSRSGMKPKSKRRKRSGSK